jgi:CRISPR-associated protein Csy1
LIEQAGSFIQSGKPQQAEQACREVLSQEPANPTAWYYLAMIEHQKGQLESALACVERAIAPGTLHLGYCMLKGLIQQDLKRPVLAEACFREAVLIKPDSAQAWNNLGIALRDQKKNDEAVDAFGRAIAADVRYFRGHNNLGTTLQSLGRLADAIDCYQRAIQFDPGYFIATHNLAAAYLAAGNEPAANEWFRKTLTLKPDYLPSYLEYGRWMLARRNYAGAEEWCLKAVEINPQNIEALHLLAEVLATVGKSDQSLAAYRHAAELDPGNLRSAIGAALSLPHVYQNREQMEAVRARFEAGLDALKSNAEIFAQSPPERIIDHLKWNNFFLAYQGKDDKLLQEKFSGFLEDMLTRAAPRHMAPIEAKNCLGRRIRVGFIGAFFHECTAGTYFNSWVTQLDRGYFETYVYYLHAERDAVTDKVESAADHFKHLQSSPLQIADEVAADDLDILIYPEVGMNGKACVLSAMRLAPVQCMAWGHPVTTGHANMDYYFSSALMEPENAQRHYSEKLVLLPGIGTCYPKPEMPSPIARSELGLPDDKHLYLCPQSLFKIHPDNDALFVRILEQDKDGVLVFFASAHQAVTNAFINRMVESFAKHGLDKTGRVKILPMLEHDDYLRVNMVCDVMLDTLHWSGGNTTLDALSCGLPMATLPGAFMRGRQSLGMLTALAIPELIAINEEDYVRIALQLGRDSDYRQQLSARIQANLDKIFDDQAPLVELTKFLRQAAKAT